MSHIPALFAIPHPFTFVLALALAAAAVALLAGCWP